MGVRGSAGPEAAGKRIAPRDRSARRQRSMSGRHARPIARSAGHRVATRAIVSPRAHARGMGIWLALRAMRKQKRAGQRAGRRSPFIWYGCGFHRPTTCDPGGPGFRTRTSPSHRGHPCCHDGFRRPRARRRCLLVQLMERAVSGKLPPRATDPARRCAPECAAGRDENTASLRAENNVGASLVDVDGGKG